jgi:hypothetical protein
MTSFITISELKTYPLPVTAAQWAKVTDAKVEEILEKATDHIIDWLERDIVSAYYTETIPGNNRYTLMLDAYPLTSVSLVTAIDIIGNETEYDGTMFNIDRAGIIQWKDRLNHWFSRDKAWRVEYRAGYDVVPGPLKHAVALQAVQMLQPLFRGGADFVQVELIDGLQESIVDMCESYKRKRMG